MRILRIPKEGIVPKANHHFRIGNEVWEARVVIGRYVLARFAWSPDDPMSLFDDSHRFSTIDHVMGISVCLLLLFGSAFVEWLFS